MSIRKSSNFERESRDYYPTPETALEGVALGNFFWDVSNYIEPCAGDGRLVKHMSKLVPHAVCSQMFDIEPQEVGIVQKSLFDLTQADIGDDVTHFVTNPPWINTKATNFQLNRLIEHLSSLRPTWLLLNGTYIFNQRSAKLLKDTCTDIVPVGRLKWIEGSKHTGTEDCAWYKFDRARFKTRTTRLHQNPKGIPNDD